MQQPKNIRKIIAENIGRLGERQQNIKRAHITAPILSRFLNERAYINCYALVRLMLAMGFKIYDKNNNLLLGNPDNIDQEILDNKLVPIEEDLDKEDELHA